MLTLVGAINSMPRSAKRARSAVRRSGYTNSMRCSKSVSPVVVHVDKIEVCSSAVVCCSGISINIDSSGRVIGAILPSPIARTVKEYQVPGMVYRGGLAWTQ